MAELKATVTLLFRDLLSPGLSATAAKITGAVDAISGGATRLAAGSAGAASSLEAAAAGMGASYATASRAIGAEADRTAGAMSAAADNIGSGLGDAARAADAAGSRTGAAMNAAADSTGAAARAVGAAGDRIGNELQDAARAADAAAGRTAAAMNAAAAGIGSGLGNAARAADAAGSRTGAAMNAAADSTGAAARAIGAASDHIGSDLTAAGRAADAAADRIASGADRAARAWRAVDLAANLGQASAEVTQLAAGLGRAVDAGADAAIATESALGRLGTVLTEANTGGDVAGASRQVYAAAFDAATGRSEAVGELAAIRVPAFIDATFTGVSSGLSTDQAIAATERAAILGAGTGATVGESATLLNTLFNTFGNKAAATDLPGAQAEFERLADVVGQTQQYYAFEDLGQLGEGLKNAAGAALNFGVPLDQLAAVLGTLNTLGIVGPEAGTATAVAIEQMGRAAAKLGFDVARAADGSIDMLATLQEVAAGGFSAEQISEAFGDEAGRAVGLLLQGMDLFAGGLEVDTAGASMRAAGEVADTYAARLERLQASSKALAGELGRGSVAVRQWGVDVASWGLSALAGAGAGREAVAAFAGGAMQVASAGAQGAAGALELSTGVLSATTLLGKAGPFARELADGTMVGPLQRFGQAASRMGGGVSRVFGGLGPLAANAGGTIAKAFGSSARVVAGAAGSIGAGIGRIVAGIGPMIAGAAASIPVNFTWAASMWAATWPVLAIVAGIAVLAGLVYLVIRNWDKIGPFFVDLWQSIIGVFKAAWDWIKGLWDKFLGLFGRKPEADPGLAAAGAEVPGTMAEGVTAGSSRFGSAVSDALDTATPLIPSSDAERGPLSRLTAAGRAIPATIAAGMLAASPVLADGLAPALAPGGELPALAASYPPAEAPGSRELIPALAPVLGAGPAPAAGAPADLAPGPAPALAEAPDGRDLVRALRELSGELRELRAERSGRAAGAARPGAARAAGQVHVDQLDVRLDETGDMFRTLEELAVVAGEPL